MNENNINHALNELIHDLEENISAVNRFIIGLVEILTPAQRLALTDTIFELNQTAESTIPQNKEHLLKRAKLISEKTLALLESSKAG